MMELSDTYVEIKTGLAKTIAYLMSGGLVIGDYMEYLNNNAGAFGIIIGFCTFLVNWIYQYKNSKIIRRKHRVERRQDKKARNE